MKSTRRWQDMVNAVLGVWLIVSPWVASFSADHVALANMVVVGILLLAVALGASIAPRAWEEWSEGVLGAWMIASPWVLGFHAISNARSVAVATGVVVVVLAWWTLAANRGTDWTHKEIAH